MCQIKTVKKKKKEEYKVSQNFFPSVDQSSFPSFCDFLSFPFWMILKKKYSYSGCNSPPRTSSLPPFYLLLFLLLLLSLLFSHWNLWENQANSLGPICVQSSRFYCNSCKVGGDCGTIALMHSYCILLFSKRKESYWFSELNWQFPLSIFSVAPTTSRITVKCSNATWSVGVAVNR